MSGKETAWMEDNVEVKAITSKVGKERIIKVTKEDAPNNDKYRVKEKSVKMVIHF